MSVNETRERQRTGLEVDVENGWAGDCGGIAGVRAAMKTMIVSKSMEGRGRIRPTW